MMRRLVLTGLLTASIFSPATAQAMSPWGDDPFWERSPRRYEQRDRDDDNFDAQPNTQKQPSVVFEGGPRPEIAPKAPPLVSFPHNYAASSIVIDVSGRRLYYVLEGGQAYQYTISVGREGFSWTGTEVVSRVQAWPDWHPPAEMRMRDPKLPEKMTGGLRNPLGAMALYLGNTLYRIHGTNDAKTIGQAASSGCFRMLNASVIHLATLAGPGTTVQVVKQLDGDAPPVAARTPNTTEPQTNPSYPDDRQSDDRQASRDYQELYGRRAPQRWSRWDDRANSADRYDPYDDGALDDYPPPARYGRRYRDPYER